MKLSQEGRIALEHLVQYTIDEEGKHYDESGKPNDHIYLKILLLKKIIMKNKPTILKY